MHGGIRATIAALGCAFFSSFVSADVCPEEQFVGEYRQASASRAREDIGDAIAQATAPMGLLARGIAKRRLEELNPAYPTIRVAQRGELLAASFAGRTYVAPTDGKLTRNEGPDGCGVDVSYAVVGNTLRARYVAKEGEKRVDLTAGPGGQTLAVRVTVLSQRLPRPVRYALSYVKVN
jgi:hypothetical protein